MLFEKNVEKKFVEQGIVEMSYYLSLVARDILYAV